MSEYHVKGSSFAKRTLAIAVQAKNATITRNGITAEQAVFGRKLRLGESCNTDDDHVLMSVLGSDGPAWLDAQMRTAARIAMLSRDCSEKVRRAMLRRAPEVVDQLCPGTRVYFWSPHPQKGRYREDEHRWRGPATVTQVSPSQNIIKEYYQS